MKTAAVLLTVTLVAAMVSPGFAAGVKYSNWSVNQTFDDKGQTTCSLRFRAVQGEQSLSLDAKKPPKSSALGASFNLGGLPPYLAGKTGTIRGSKWLSAAGAPPISTPIGARARRTTIHR